MITLAMIYYPEHKDNPTKHSLESIPFRYIADNDKRLQSTLETKTLKYSRNPIRSLHKETLHSIFYETSSLSHLQLPGATRHDNWHDCDQMLLAIVD